MDRRRAPVVAIGILAAALLLLVGGVAAAKSFHFTLVEIDAEVRRDGSMRIVEGRTYDFDGSFRFATYRLPLRGAGDIRDIRIADERGPYRVAGGEEPGTFQVTRSPGEVTIKWFYRAADERRTFTISYLLTDVVTVYSDVAELFWKFIGTGWDVRSDQVLVIVRLPGNVPRQEILVWGHGPLQGVITPEDGRVRLTVNGLPAFAMVEGRILFPPSAVPAATKRVSRFARDAIVAEESAAAASANRQRQVAQGVLALLIVYPLAALAIFLGIYLRHGREHEPTVPDEYYRELPGTYSPSELGVLWRFRRVRPDDFVATVMDLARRGYLTITQQESGLDDEYVLTPTYVKPPKDRPRPRRWLGIFRRAGLSDEESAEMVEAATEQVDEVAGKHIPDRDALWPHERRALEMLFGRTGRPVRLTRAGIQGAAKVRLQRGFSKWMRQTMDTADRHEWFDRRSATVRKTVRTVAGLLAVGAVLALFWGFVSSPRVAFLAVESIPLGIVLAVMAFALDRRSQKGADEFRRWRGFQRFLRDFSEMEGQPVPALTVWEHYLVYAIPLGVADRVLRALRTLIPAQELARSTAMGWYTSSSGDGFTSSAGMIDGMRAFTSTFTSTVAAAASPPSSGGGGGGGFSGGGGGGGGGGGSGGSAG